MIQPYVLITPAHNEQAHLEGVVESVLRQTARPMRWVLVDDRSSDGTDALASAWARRHDFIRVLRREGEPNRHFANKAAAFNAALPLIEDLPYRYIGNLDADIELSGRYYETVLGEFERDPRLGIAGGPVWTRGSRGDFRQWLAPDSVPGAVQLFRRECFLDIGNRYQPLARGGIDAAAEITARMRGWKVKHFPHSPAFENRRMGCATGGILQARFREGARFHSLGYDPLFYALRAVYKCLERPWAAGSLAALTGFFLARWRGEPVSLSSEAVSFLRTEQRLKMRAALGLRT